MNLTLRVLSRPEVAQLPRIYSVRRHVGRARVLPRHLTRARLSQQLGEDFDERVLPSIANEVLKAVVVRCSLGRSAPVVAETRCRAPQAQFNADQLLTQREQVSSQVRLRTAAAGLRAEAALTPLSQVRAGLLKRAADFGITLEDVALTHLSFSSEYARAIEFKQVSQQEAERSKYVVLKAEQERRAAIIRAEGESESARLISNATKLTGPALIEMRRIEAAKEIAQTLSKGRNIMYVPGGQQLLMGMPGPGTQ